MKDVGNELSDEAEVWFGTEGEVGPDKSLAASPIWDCTGWQWLVTAAVVKESSAQVATKATIEPPAASNDVYIVLVSVRS